MPSLALQSGLRASYLDEGAGPPLVFVHGWSLGGAVARALPPELTSGRRVIAPDLRGHGATPAAVEEPATPRPPAAGSDRLFGLEELARDLAELVEALELREILLAGWSLGAQVALAALPRLGARVRRLALFSATPCFTAREGWAHGLPAGSLAALARRVARAPARATAGFFEGMFVDGELDAAGGARAAALRAVLAPPDPGAALAGLEVLRATDLRPALAGVDVPTLVLHGERDPICLAGAGRFLAAAIPGARLALVPGAGHAPFLSRPAEVAAALGGFLEGA